MARELSDSDKKVIEKAAKDLAGALDQYYNETVIESIGRPVLDNVEWQIYQTILETVLEINKE